MAADVVAHAHGLAAQYFSTAVIAPLELHPRLQAEGLVVAQWGEGIALLDPATAKGLEFDAVIVVDPNAI